MKHLFSLLVIVILLATAGIAAAGERVSGTGTLTAEGDGRALLRGDGTVDINGNGTLYVVDRGGDAEINVTGHGGSDTIERRGYTILRYRGFNGTAHVSGSDIIVSVNGVNISLQAEGTGTVRLTGEGTFTIGNQQGVWTAEGITIELHGE